MYDRRLFSTDPEDTKSLIEDVCRLIREEHHRSMKTNDTIVHDGKIIGEVYEMESGHGWGYVEYASDLGYDVIDTRDEAIESLIADYEGRNK